MMQIVLIGIGTGLAGALLFSSPIGGTSLALPLFALTGLPIAVAGLGWTPLAAAVASIAGSVAIFVMISPLAAGVFIFLFALPMAWLVYLAGLWRQNGGVQQWYPLGRLLFNAAAGVAIGLLIVGYLVGFDPEGMAENITEALSSWLSNRPDLDPVPTREEIEPFVRLNVALLPYSLAALTLIVQVFNLWLAGLVTRTSGRLARPRERMWTVSLPASAALAFVIAAVVSFLPFPLGYIAALVAGALGGAFFLLGLAVIHALTLGLNGRALLLVLNYIALALLGFTAVIIAALGITEIFFNLRARRFGGAPPT